MNAGSFGRWYVYALSAYFILAGLGALLDVDSKLSRVGLQAQTDDGKIAFVLIYCSLMVGVGTAMLVLSWASKGWLYSAILVTVVVSSFVAFRVVGAIMVGHVTGVQATYLTIEVVEVLLGVSLILLSKRAAPGPL